MTEGNLRGNGGGEGQSVPPTEDLMREHAVLGRLLLIYEEGIRRIRGGQPPPAAELQQASRLIREFIQDYHEHLEEQWVFPAFQKAGQQLELVTVLKQQHERGRAMVDIVKQLAGPASLGSPARAMEMAQAASRFIRMYRPHKAREGSVLFPRLRDVVTPAEFAAMGEAFEQEEQRRFGKDGFERIVNDVAQLEKSLGIYNLAQFTP